MSDPVPMPPRWHIFHRWGRWQDRFIQQTPPLVRGQKRSCVVCGKEQIRAC